MKNRIIIFTVTLTLLLTGLVPVSRVEAQIIKGVAIAGFNATQVDGDEVFGYKKFGWNVGASAIIPITKKWMIGIENIYNQKGSFQKVQFSDSAKNGAYRLNLDYVEVPVLLFFEDKETMIFGTGFSWGRLIGVKEYENGNRVETTTLNKGPYDRNDWNFLVDVRFRLYKRIKFNFRYAYSVMKIRERQFSNYQSQWDRKQYNNALTFRLLYYINEKPPVPRVKKH